MDEGFVMVLRNEITMEFHTKHSVAEPVAVKAAKFAAQVQSNPDGWEGPSEVDPDYIISRLKMAPNHLGMTEKWNWWVGIQNVVCQDEYQI